MCYLQVHANFATITKSCVITSNDISCFTCVTSHMLPSSSILHYTLPHFNAGINNHHVPAIQSTLKRTSFQLFNSTRHTPLQSFNTHRISHPVSFFKFFSLPFFIQHTLRLIHRGRGEGHTFHLSCVLFANCVVRIKIL